MNIIQDVIPHGDGERGIRRIPMRSGKSSDMPARRTTSPQTGSSGKGWFKTIAYLSSFIVIVFIVAFSTIWASGKLTVTPKQQQTILDTEITAYKNPPTGELLYTLMTVESSESKEIPASGEREVSERASGTIVVYNDYSTASQRLIKNTRFETPEGLIYRIQESIVVPGRKTENNKTVAGSIETKVYADVAGDKYNIGLADFTIPGFKGDPRYEKFYARSKTSMTGGFVGMKKVVEESALNTARAELDAKLKSDLYKKAGEQVPSGFTLYNDAIFLGEPEENQESKDTSVVLSIKMSLYATIFDKAELSKVIALKTLGDWDGSDVMVDNIDDLDFTVKDKAVVKPWLEESVVFSLVGNPLVVYSFDEEELKKELAGKGEKASRVVLTRYPSIERAEIKIVPFWMRSFPSDPEKIKIIKNINAVSN